MTPLLDLGPDDFLVYPRAVHVMRYGGRNDEGQRFWRLACGSRMTSDTWDGGYYQPTVAEVEQHGLAVCGNCARTKARAS